MELEPGARLRSAVCETEVVVVRAPADDVDLRCGGAAMVSLDDDAPTGVALAPDRAGGTAIGKRYASEELGLELLCTKAGAGALSIGDDELPRKGAKPLPASD